MHAHHRRLLPYTGHVCRGRRVQCRRCGGRHDRSDGCDFDGCNALHVSFKRAVRVHVRKGGTHSRADVSRQGRGGEACRLDETSIQDKRQAVEDQETETTCWTGQAEYQWRHAQAAASTPWHGRPEVKGGRWAGSSLCCAGVHRSRGVHHPGRLARVHGPQVSRSARSGRKWRADLRPAATACVRTGLSAAAAYLKEAENPRPVDGWWEWRLRTSGRTCA